MKICILLIATNKYIQFVEPLLENIEEKFLKGHEKHCLLFTDHEIEEVSENVTVHQIEHEPWPMPTLKRYNYFIEKKDFISEFDYCFYFDVDMKIIADVGDEVLSDLVATMHPYQSFFPPMIRSYERDTKSLASVPVGQEPQYYCAGGFNGGSTKEFLKMAEKISFCVNKDLESNVVALWHDESHMNKYFTIKTPTKFLTPEYCFAEEFIGSNEYPYTNPKIVALKKNHNELRS